MARTTRIGGIAPFFLARHVPTALAFHRGRTRRLDPGRASSGKEGPR